jgi:Tfp pilus assembly protein PilO
MSRIHWKYLLVLTFILLPITAYRLLVPIYSENIRLIGEIFDKAKQPDDPEIVREETLLLKTNNSRRQSVYKNLVSFIPTANNLSEIYKSLQHLAQTNKINLRRITPHPVEEYEHFRKLEMDIECSTDYDGFLSFLFRLENDSLIFQLEEVSLIRAEHLRDKLEGTIKLVTFLRADNYGTEKK